MATGVLDESEQGMAPLVSGIVSDAGRLISQQFTLLRRELEEEIRRAKAAAISLAVGAGIITVGSIFLLLMVVYVLDFYTAIPLWGCYGLVGGLLFGTGALLLYLGGSKASNVHMLTPPQSTEAMKENLQWLKNQAKTEQA
jgi:hypothetical protein